MTVVRAARLLLESQILSSVVEVIAINVVYSGNRSNQESKFEK